MSMDTKEKISKYLQELENVENEIFDIRDQLINLELKKTGVKVKIISLVIKEMKVDEFRVFLDGRFLTFKKEDMKLLDENSVLLSVRGIERKINPSKIILPNGKKFVDEYEKVLLKMV